MLTSHERGSPSNHQKLYFFYDCEASGGSALRDQVIEVGLALLTDNLELEPSDRERLGSLYYSSLCVCETQIDEEARMKHGIDKKALEGQRPVGEVLEELFDWVTERVRDVERLRERVCDPVLVAHGGVAFDFPLLVTEVKRSECEARFRELKLQFADTHLLCQQLKSVSHPVLRGNIKLSVSELNSLFFPTEQEATTITELQHTPHRALIDVELQHTPHRALIDVELQHTPHRALSDALTLRRLFSQTELSQHLGSLELVTTEGLLERWQSSTDSHQLTERLGLHKQKARGLVRRGENLRRLEEQFIESGCSEQWLRDHLRSLGVKRPGSTCLQYFRDLL